VRPDGRQVRRQAAPEPGVMPLPRSTLAKVAPRVVSFEEQVTAVREGLAAVHEREEDWSAAAQTLAGIDLDSGAPSIAARRAHSALCTVHPPCTTCAICAAAAASV